MFVSDDWKNIDLPQFTGPLPNASKVHVSLSNCQHYVNLLCFCLQYLSMLGANSMMREISET